MKTSSALKTTGFLFICSGLLTGVCFELLRQQFSYPDILRMDTGTILQRYHTSTPFLPLLWYGMTLGSMLLMLAAFFLKPALSVFEVKQQHLITGLGVLAGLFNMLGFIRWVFLVPALAAAYADPAASQATKEAIIVVFNAFHLYLGFSVGEHAGFMFLAFWGISLSLALYQSFYFPKWLSQIGILSSVGTFIGILEGIGWRWAADVVAVSSSLLILWIMVAGFYFIKSGRKEIVLPGISGKTKLAGIEAIS